MLQSALESQTKNILNQNQYISIRRLGKGGFGHVLLATKATSSSTHYAVKCISKRKMIKDPQLKRFLLQEVNTMALLDHPHVVKLLKTFEEGDWYFLVMEYCDMGNLLALQNKQPLRLFPLDDALALFSQVLAGVDFIHLNNIIHRDLKLENIFLRRHPKSGSLLCKIGDFGLARPIGEQETALTNCGTEIYMAPQILSGHAYDRQADVWSLGVLFYYLLIGDFPFKGINILDQIRKRCHGGYKIGEHVKLTNYCRSPREEILLADLFEKVFQMNPANRLPVRELMRHALLRKDKEMKDEGKQTKEQTKEETTEEVTTQEDEDEQMIQWEISRVQFIQKIVEAVSSYNCLSFYLSTAFKFYINKVLLYFLNREPLKSYRRYEANPTDLHLRLADLHLRLTDQLLIQHSLLLKNSHLKEPIERFEDGFNTKVEDFTVFKMSYRNTVGRVYEQVHKKLADSPYERSALKLKLFFCHIINRVFTGPVNPAIFPYYTAWVKKTNPKLSLRLYDFGSIEEWIRNEKPQNLQRAQDTINQMFYK